MFKDLFDVFKESTEWIDEFEKFMKNQENNKSSEKDNKNHSCYHYVCDKYENGKNVYHQEKEIKDGKVLKDEGHGCGCISNNDDTSIKSDSECKKNCTENSKPKEYEKAVANENEALKQKNCKLRSYINKLECECEEYKNEICELKKENEELRRKFDAIKSMF